MQTSGRPPEGVLQVSPDLAVEVVSPNDNARDLDEKIGEYLEGGIRLVWVIFPDARHAFIYRRDYEVEHVPPGGVLDGEDILPGLKIPLESILRPTPPKSPGAGAAPRA